MDGHEAADVCIVNTYNEDSMAKLPWDTPRPKAKPEPMKERSRSASPYHTWRWTKLSRAFRAEHPLCAECQRRGIITPATCVDHIVPWPICADNFYDKTNLQSLCEDCNNKKGQRDKARIEKWRKTHRP